MDEILKRTSCGSVCVNDTLMQLSSSNLPFGGVGKNNILWILHVSVWSMKFNFVIKLDLSFYPSQSTRGWVQAL